MRHFDDFLKSYMKYTVGHEGSPRFHLWSAISVVAACMERKVWIDRGYYTLYPNLYTFLIGKSGLVKKSTTTGIAVGLLRKIPGMKLSSERLTPASLIEQLHNAGKTFQYKEKTVKQSAVFAYASELSVFMQEVAGSISELLTTFYDCIPNDSSQPWIYETKGQGMSKVFGPCLNILGASTKAWLSKSIPANEMEGGFASRIVFVVENKNPDKIVAWPKLSPELIEMRTKLEEDLFHIHQLVGEMEISPGAYTNFENWYEFHMRNVVPECVDPRMAGYMGRKGDLLLKLAMIRAVTLRDDLILQESDVLWAGSQLQLIEPEMRDSFEGIGGSPSGQITFDVRNYIKNRDAVEKSEILRAFAKNATGKEIEAVLQDLVEMNEIQVVLKNEGGVSKPAYSVSRTSGTSL